jgi:hypothetical protein
VVPELGEGDEEELVVGETIERLADEIVGDVPGPGLLLLGRLEGLEGCLQTT